MSRGAEVVVVVYGIDVGVTGAVAVMVNGRLLEVADLPVHVVGVGSVKRQVDAAGLAAQVRDWRRRLGPDAEHVVVERVASRPGQSAPSVFSLGHSFGVCTAVMAALGVPMTLVPPQTWKRAFGLGRDKSQSQAAASRLFPDGAGHWARVKDHNRAEAVLLAAYGVQECV